MANIDLKNGINSDEDKKQSFGQYYQEELDSMGLESGICLSWSKLTCTITQEVQYFGILSTLFHTKI